MWRIIGKPPGEFLSVNHTAAAIGSKAERSRALDALMLAEG
jgi:hypothetical protein